MLLFILKTLIAALLISFVSWFSGKNTSLAGFLTALPLTSMLALGFSNLEWGDDQQSFEYAKSVFLAVPISLVFFVPFLFSKKTDLSFWNCFLLGVVLLFLGYHLHNFLTSRV